jgi:hypothetical protein
MRGGEILALWEAVADATLLHGTKLAFLLI